MQCVIVDSDKECCGALSELCEQTGKLETAAVFDRAAEALSFIRRVRPELALVGWELPDMCGRDFAEKARDRCDDIALVFISETDRHAIEAFDADACGYLVKPIDRRALENCINRVDRRSLQRRPQHDIYVQTFGHFDVYVDGVAMIFRNSRAKEMLAMMVDRRGGLITVERFVQAFWPDETDTEKHKAIFRKALLSLKNTLEEYGVADILITSRNQKAIIAKKIRCDYYDFLDGRISAIRQYNGEYMKAYGWAENTNGKLCQIAEKQEGSLLYQRL